MLIFPQENSTEEGMTWTQWGRDSTPVNGAEMTWPDRSAGTEWIWNRTWAWAPAVIKSDWNSQPTLINYIQENKETFFSFLQNKNIACIALTVLLFGTFYIFFSRNLSNISKQHSTGSQHYLFIYFWGMIDEEAGWNRSCINYNFQTIPSILA